MPLASQNPYPFIVYSVANCTPNLSHFWANVNFAIQLRHFLFMNLPCKPFQLSHPKTECNTNRIINTVTFVFVFLFLFFCFYRKSSNFFTQKIPTVARIFSAPKSQKMCYPILVNLLKYNSIRVNLVVKMRPHTEAHPH